MKRVGIYRTVFPITSETFITEQALGLNSYDPLLITRSKISDTQLKTVAISDNDFLKAKQTLFWITRNEAFLGETSSFSNLNLIHAHFGADGTYAMPLADRLFLPLVVTLHGCESELFHQQFRRPLKYRSQLKLQSLHFMLNERKLVDRTSYFIAVSNFIKKKLLDSGYPEEKLVVHYIGVDTEKFSPIAVSSSPSERYILCVGRHVRKKGIDTLLKAFSYIHEKHPDVTVIQIGSGELTTELHLLAAQLKIQDKVKFLGAQSHQEVLRLMQLAEIFALPSQTTEDGSTEGLPFSINEASACGIPVVSTWHAGIPEAVVDKETGFLVVEQDSYELSEKLDALLSNRDLSRKMGKAGREYVCKMFDIRKQTQKLEKIYDSAVEEWRKVI